MHTPASLRSTIASLCLLIAAIPAAGAEFDPHDPFAPRQPAPVSGGAPPPRSATSAGAMGLVRSSEKLGGRLETMVNGVAMALPTLKTDIFADIAGDLATVTVVQTFTNPSPQAMHATYVFPLNEEAAVFEMTMMIGDEVIRATIDQIDAARQTFETAKQEGRSAALLSEHRPNLFTQEIANLMPELPVTVTIRYVQTVPRIDGSYELVVPLIVGPRYVPDEEPSTSSYPLLGKEGDSERASERIWLLDALPARAPVCGIDVPDQVDGERVSIAAFLEGGMPVTSVSSATHPLAVSEVTPTQRRIELAEGRTIDNRDFVLRYQLAGDAVQAGTLAYQDERGGFFSILIEPPAVTDEASVTPREMVFVLDCSGSMAGLPLQASKAFMRAALQGLRDSDTFRVIRFSDAATEFSERPLAATTANVSAALTYIETLTSEGGTEMRTGIRQALVVPEPPNTVRLVVFLTDGYIGNEHEILRLIHEHLGDARLFAFGVGTAVNRFLLQQMGRIGRGFTRYLDPTENVDAVAAELADRLQSPVLTDIEIDWGTLAPSEVYPARIGDLFAGHSLRVQGRYGTSGTHDIVVHGRINNHTATLPLRLQLGDDDHGDAVALKWARSAIADAMEQLVTPRPDRWDDLDDDEIQARVTQLGLDFSLVTRWTAFVAASDKVVNPSSHTAVDASVPVPMVAGVTAGAYQEPLRSLGYAPSLQQAYSSGSGFSGAASPEPATITGLLIAAGAGLASALRRRRV